MCRTHRTVFSSKAFSVPPKWDSNNSTAAVTHQLFLSFTIWALFSSSYSKPRWEMLVFIPWWAASLPAKPPLGNAAGLDRKLEVWGPHQVEKGHCLHQNRLVLMKVLLNKSSCVSWGSTRRTCCHITRLLFVLSLGFSLNRWTPAPVRSDDLRAH